MSVVLQYTYQNSQTMADLNRQLYDLSERLKKAFLECATTEAADTIELKVQQDSDSVSERLAKISLDVNENSAKVNLLATYDTARASVTLSAALVNGIEQSNVTLSGDHIILDGDVTINRGFTLSGDHISAGTITATQIAGATITAAEIAAHTITAAEISTNYVYAGSISADQITSGYISASRISAGNLDLQGYSINLGTSGTRSGYIRYEESGGFANGAVSALPNFWTINLAARRMWLNAPSTVSSSPNLVRANDNEISISSASSRRWKHNIRPIEDEDIDPQKLYSIPVVQFIYNQDYLKENDQRYDKDIPGFIAEDIKNIYPIACDLDVNGEPADWNARYIIPPMLKLIQEQNERIKRLEAHYE